MNEPKNNVVKNNAVTHNPLNIQPRRRTVLSLLAASPLLAVAACSGGKADEKKSGGTLRVGAIAATPAVHDPHGSLFNEADWVRLAAIYDALIGIDAQGRPAPGIATKWTMADDAKSWTFTLRQDATFSNGKKVTAKDVMYSLKRIADAAMENGGRLGTVDIAKSKADGDHSVRLVTSEPDAELPRTLMATSFIVPDGFTAFDKPVGSGPYTLKSANAQAATLERHTKWWGQTKAERIVLRSFSDPTAMTRAITTNALDVALGAEGAAAKSVASHADVQIVRRTAETSAPLLMHLGKAPFDNADVREAVRLGLDRDALVKTAYLGYGSVGSGLQSPNDPSAPKVAAPKRDVAKAKELLKKAGHADGLSVELHTTNAYPAMTSAAKLIASQLDEIGIKVKVVNHGADTYWTKTYTQVPLCMGYYADMPFPVRVRQTDLSTAAFNETGFKNKQFDDTFAKAMSTKDEAQRRKLLGDMQKTFMEESGVVQWGYGDGLTIARKGVQGLTSTPGLARLMLTSVQV